MNLEELQQLADINGVTRIDLRVTDLLGRWQHFTVPPKALTTDLFQNGSGFAGSSLRGFQEIHESDMLLVPDIETAVLDLDFRLKMTLFEISYRNPSTKSDTFGRSQILGERNLL